MLTATYVEVSAPQVSTGILFSINHAVRPCVFIHISVCVQTSWLRGARTHTHDCWLFVWLFFSWLNHRGQWEFNWIREQRREKEKESEREREGGRDSMCPYRLRSVYLFVLDPPFFSFLLFFNWFFQNEVKGWIHPSKFTGHRHIFGAGFALVFPDTEGRRRQPVWWRNGKVSLLWSLVILRRECFRCVCC